MVIMALWVLHSRRLGLASWEAFRCFVIVRQKLLPPLNKVDIMQTSYGQAIEIWLGHEEG